MTVRHSLIRCLYGIEKDRRKFPALLILAMLCLVLCSMQLQMGYRYVDTVTAMSSSSLAASGAEAANEDDDYDWDNLDADDRPGDTWCTVYSLDQAYRSDFRCVKTRTKPKVSVCVYHDWQDMFISHDLVDTGLWEWHILKDIQAVLRLHPEAGFIDVGANIGFYSLIAAKMGHGTVAIEPFLESVYRLHRGALINEAKDKLVVVQNGVADHRVKATVRASGDNQGDTRIELGYPSCIGSCPPYVYTILLDDVLEVTNFSQAIMKIDVQGFEHKALLHSEKLLDTIDIPYIFMEWLMMKEHFVSDVHVSNDKVLVQDLIKFMFNKNYRPYRLSYDGGGPLSPDNWPSWPHDIVWHKLPTQKEYQQLMKHHFLQWPL